MSYEKLHFSQGDIEAELYKPHLGGGAESWHGRGVFQLHLLQSRGLTAASRLVEMGCGPLRAGVHLIAFLDEGRYCGTDSSQSFVEIAHQIIVQQGLSGKNPTVVLDSDFSAFSEPSRFDFGLLFSVLNHCTPDQRRSFFRNAPRAFAPGCRVLVSHASRWFTPHDLDGSDFALSHVIEPDGFDLKRYGWDETANVFPILEFTVNEGRRGTRSR